MASHADVREPSQKSSESSQSWQLNALIAVVAFLVMWALSTDVGYEGDDINTYIPMMYLDAAKNGLFEIYRYHWQPLSYELGALVYQATGSIRTVQLMSTAAIAAMIGLLVHGSRRAGIPVILSLSALLAYPEAIFSGLYFNTSALAALPAVAGGLLAMNARHWAAALSAGILLTIAALFRLDFILCGPVLFMLALVSPVGWRAAWLLSAGSVAAFAAATVIGLFDPSATFETYRASAAEIAELSQTNDGWSRERQLWILAISFSLIGFAVLGLTALYQVRGLLRGSALLVRLGFIAAVLPSLIVVQTLLSSKYLLPFAICMALIAIRFWRDVPDWAKRFSTVAIPAAALFLLLFSIDPERSAPFLSIRAADARQVPTHDGTRSHGAYAYQFLRVGWLRPETPSAMLGKFIVEALHMPENRTVAIIGAENYFATGGAAWRSAVLQLARQPHEIVPVTRGVLRIDTPEGVLWLATHPRLLEERVPEADCIFDLLSEESAEEFMHRTPPCGD
jgi:hypothetical protein